MTVVVVFFMMMGGMCSCDAWAAAASNETQSTDVEIFVSGQKFPSIAAYRIKKEQDQRVKQEEHAESRANDEPVMGRMLPSLTLQLPATNQVLGAGETLGQGGIKQPEAPEALVAGVSPSLSELLEGFNQVGQHPASKSVKSSEDLTQQLEQDIASAEGPILVLSDDKKVKLLNLQY